MDSVCGGVMLVYMDSGRGVMLVYMDSWGGGGG